MNTLKVLALKPSHSLTASQIPRGDYGCGYSIPRNLEELKLLDFKEDLRCGFYRGEIRKPRRRDKDSSDEDDEPDLEQIYQAERERVEAEEKDLQHRIRKKAAALQLVALQQGEDDIEALQKIEHSKEKKRMLSLTPLNYQINKQQREEILEVLEIWTCHQLTQSKMVEMGWKTEALYMLVEGTCSIKISLKDGQTVEIQRAAGDWFPYPMVFDTATPYDLVASPGSTFLVISGQVNFDRIIKPIINHSTALYLSALLHVFKGLQEYEAVRLLAIGSIHHARKDQAVIREGQMSANLVIIVRGSCILTKEGSRLSVVESPHIFGQVSVYHALPNPVSVTTNSPAQFILIPKRDLIPLVQSIAGLKSVAQRLEIDSAAGTRWLFQRTRDSSISAMFGGNTSASIEESRQRQMITRTLPKGASANPIWGGDEASRPPVPPAQNSSSQESVSIGATRQDLQRSKIVAAVQRPQSAMQLSRTITDGGAGGFFSEDARIRLTQCIEVGVDGGRGIQGGEKMRSRPQSASLARTTSSVSIGSGLKSSMEAADQNLVQIGGPNSRHESADLAKAEVMEYLRMARRRGHSLRQSKNERLEQVHLRFLKQSDMKLESGSSALTNTFISRVENTCLIRTKVSAEKESIRRFKERADPATVGRRHGLLRDRLERTMNKGTSAALKWAKDKVIADEV